MNIQGITIGLIAFIIIGVFHPIVIKSEYYFGKRVWPIFAIIGVILILISMQIENLFVSGILSITGFSSLWSIHEIIEQEKRVQKGWFPSNPNKSSHDTAESSAEKR